MKKLMIAITAIVLSGCTSVFVSDVTGVMIPANKNSINYMIDCSSGNKTFKIIVDTIEKEMKFLAKGKKEESYPIVRFEQGYSGFEIDSVTLDNGFKLNQSIIYYAIDKNISFYQNNSLYMSNYATCVIVGK